MTIQLQLVSQIETAFLGRVLIKLFGTQLLETPKLYRQPREFKRQFSRRYHHAYLLPPLHLFTQLLQQRLGVPQIRGVEALGEPVVDLGEHHA